MALLIDTDILIDAARGIPGAVEYLEREEDRTELCVSVVTEMELVVGCRDKAELHDLQDFLARFGVIQLRAPISEKASALLRQYRLSHGLLIADALIAGTAIVSGVPLATKNRRDFRFIEALELAAYP